MKHCPECNKNYADPTLSFRLNGGAELVYGLANGEKFDGDPAGLPRHGFILETRA
jgi:hypothetical protein